MSNRRHRELVGTKVVGQNGRTLGEIDDLLIDSDNWRVTNLIVRVSSEAIVDLGLAKPFWSRARIEVPIHQVSGATEVVVLRCSLEELAQLLALASAEQA